MFETSKDSFGTAEDKGNYRDGIKNKAAEKNLQWRTRIIGVQVNY